MLSTCSNNLIFFIRFYLFYQLNVIPYCLIFFFSPWYSSAVLLPPALLFFEGRLFNRFLTAPITFLQPRPQSSLSHCSPTPVSLIQPQIFFNGLSHQPPTLGLATCSHHFYFFTAPSQTTFLFSFLHLCSACPDPNYFSYL